MGAVALVGLFWQVVAITQVRSEYPPVQFNSAVCIALLGIGLAIADSRWRLLGRVLGAGAILLSALTFAQYLLGMDLGVDRLFFEPSTSRGAAVPGRMAPNAAVSFLMVAAGVKFLSRGSFHFAAAALGAISFTLGGAVLVGYLAGVPEAFAWRDQTQMAFLTAASIVLLGAGIVAAAHRVASGHAGRAWWGSLLAGVAISAAGLVLWNALHVEHFNRLQSAVRSDARAARAEITTNVRLRIDRLELYGQRAGGRNWNASTEELVGVDGVEWYSLSDIQAIVNGPPVSEEGNQEQRELLQQALAYVQAERSAAVVGPFVVSGEVVVRLLVPVSRFNQLEGVLAGVLPSAAIFSETTPLSGPEWGLNLQVLCGGRGVYRVTAGAATVPWSVSLSVPLPGPLPWGLVVSPGTGYLPAEGGELPEVVLGVSLSIALLLSLSAQFGQTQTARAERLEATVRGRTDELEWALQELHDANAAKDHFIGMLGHELRNPLGAILSATELVRLGDEPWDRAVDVIHREGAHLSRILDDLLDVSRIVRGQLVIERQTVDLGRLAREAAAVQQQMIDAKAVDLEIRTPSRPVWIEADPTRVHQVVGNLLGNAVKFSNPKGHVQLVVTADADKGIGTLRLIDEGKGIDPAELERIFEPFFQSEARSKKGMSGLGLGLSIVKALVEAHGGRIRARSEGLGRGTEFIVEFPIVDLQRDEWVGDAVVSAVDLAQPREVETGQGLVLLIEDHPAAAEMMGRLVSRFGYHVEGADNGSEGIEIARRRRPDIVLCDLGLPDLDGYEVARRLKGDPTTADVPLIAISGYGREQDVEKAFEAGFLAHLLKPVDPAELQAALRRHLGDASEPGAAMAAGSELGEE